MTKREMIQTIQVAEAKAWKDYQDAKALWGDDNAVTTRRRQRWSTIYDMRETLGIDVMTWDDRKALGLAD